MLILGLTGGIATGKSTVSSYFSEKYNIPIVDADKIARDVVNPHTPAYNAIIKHFSPNVSNLVNTKNGQLNRTALGAYVFGNENELKTLNSITHPAVKRQIVSQIFNYYIQKRPVIILDIPLMFESGMDWLCSRVVTVTCDSNIQINRLLKRNPELTVAQAQNRINSQLSLSQKTALSDYVIENNGSMEDLKLKVDNFVSLNLPALGSYKKNGISYLVHNFWNYMQVIFPPFALLGGIWALLRKLGLKMLYKLTNY